MEMKRSFLGFTLAEVLITLGIIGVIAALTIPTLIKNSQTTALKSQFKKFYAVYEAATKTIAQDYGGDYTGINIITYVSELQKRLNITKVCTSGANGCWHPINSWYNTNGTIHGWALANPTTSLVLQDGSYVGIFSWYPTCSDTAWGTKNGKGICGEVLIDVNGAQKPNTSGQDIFGILPQNDSLWLNSTDAKKILIGP